MASKDKIRQHLAQSASISLGISKPTTGDEAKKMKKLEHLQKSLNKDSES